MEKKDVKVTLKDGVLRIEGTRELYLENDETLKRGERAQGSFIRSFSCRVMLIHHQSRHHLKMVSLQ